MLELTSICLSILVLLITAMGLYWRNLSEWSIDRIFLTLFTRSAYQDCYNAQDIFLQKLGNYEGKKQTPWLSDKYPHQYNQAIHRFYQHLMLNIHNLYWIGK